MLISQIATARRRLLASGYTANPVRLDGSTTYLSKGSSFGSDFAAFTLAFWLKMNAGDGSAQRIMRTGDGDYFSVQRTSGNAITILGATSGGGTILNVTTSDTGFTVAAGWRHVLASVNLGVANGCYVDDSSVTLGSGSSGTIDVTRSDFAVGAQTGGTEKLSADLADVQLYSSYLDLSVASNRRHFIDAGGLPVDPAVAVAALGTPELLLTGATASWHTNQGSGGGFTENGALTDGSSPVSL